MDANSTAIIIAIIFAVIIIAGFIIFRRRAKVDLELPGSKLKFEGGNDSAKSVKTGSKNKSNGIFGNISIGKTRIKVKGSGAVAENKSVGDTTLTKEDLPSTTKKKSK
jgi:hypothetical protein